MIGQIFSKLKMLISDLDNITAAINKILFNDARFRPLT